MELGSRETLTALLHPTRLFCRLSDATRQYRQGKCLSADAVLGKRGEDMAHRYLQRSGYAVIARNYRPSGGEAEIDIVARRAGITVFVEVKTRSGSEYGAPDRAIGSAKQKNIVRAARRYAARAGIEWSAVRFDTIAIVPGRGGSLVHQQDAFFEGRAI
jgi:putative endonuclease